MKFISDCVNHKPVATRTAFTLKLLAILCEGAITNKFDIVNSIAFFQCSQNDGSLFNKSIKETVLDASPVIVGPPYHLLQLNLEFARGVFLWENASVRCAWFDAVSKASAISSFNVILQSVGAFDVAWNCLNDSSMFVKSAAEDFLAVASLDQFRTSHLDAPIREQVAVDTTEASVREGHSDCTKDADKACPQRKEHFSSEIFQKLLMVITVSYPEPSREIEPDGINEKFRPKSAIEIICKMLKHDASLCLLATSQNRMVVQLCAFLTGGASNNAAFDVVDLLTELMTLSPFSERLSICEILQDVPKTLLSRQNEALSASYLASALWRLETRSAKKEEHFKFVILPVVLMIQSDNDISEVFGPIDEVCLQVFGDACQQGKPTCPALVSLSLNSMLDYAKQMPLTHKEMEIFGVMLVKLLQCLQGENATNSLTHSLIGSAKLSKKCFDVLATICKSHTLGKDFHWVDELFTVAVSVVCDPDTNITLLSKLLEVLSEPAMLLSSDGNDDLAFAIQKLLMSESSWERRDSAIGFIDRVIRNVNNTRWVCKHNFPRFLWERLADHESYVRASAALSLSGLMLNDKITEVFLDDCSLSKVDVVMQLCKIVTTDNEGFARRAAMTTLTALLTHEGALREILLHFNPESCKQFETTCQLTHKQLTIPIAEFQKSAFQVHDISVTDILNDDEIIDRSLEEHHTSTAKHLKDTQKLCKCDNSWNFAMKTVNTALNDLDWEVKLSAIEYWDILMKIVLREFLSFEQASEEKSKTVIIKSGEKLDTSQLDQQVNENVICNIDYGQVNHSRLVCLLSAINCLHKMGLQTLMSSVTDYDRLVALSCCQLLIRLRQVVQLNGFTLSQDDLFLNESDTKTIGCTHCRTLADELGVHDRGYKLDQKVMQSLLELTTIDLDKIFAEKSLLINDYAHNPLLLLEDIIAAATGDNETEQLIDCY
ncbi:uncharacterized protein LOC117120589 [Anneissia japonica]|uniref:uncharacterized protein LOC117120589 n=1 Tax=Anneissia japonica TaxID=1529436 RepID=UPI0014254C33|nr:uncharacterized protein LOC117120589 [Anneissia japonica]